MQHYRRLSLETAPRTIVLANGAFPTSPLALALIDRWAEQGEPYRLVCCDGATNKLACYTDRLPDAIVGDLDSIKPEYKERMQHLLHHRPDQETNDLTKTMRFVCEQMQSREIVIIGASGGREDHLLGNLALLPTYASMVGELVMLTDTGHFRLITTPTSIDTEVGQQISVFNFYHSPVTLRGVHWPLTDATLTEMWQGTLNRADEPQVTLSCPTPCLLFFADTDKK